MARLHSETGRGNVKFTITVSDASGDEWTEQYERTVGESHHLRDYGTQPVFTGDITAWGKALVEWFNKDATASERRTFMRATAGWASTDTELAPKRRK